MADTDADPHTDLSPPRTPINPTQPLQQTHSPSFATAILDPGSDPVLAARHRSKSEAQILHSAFYPRRRNGCHTRDDDDDDDDDDDHIEEAYRGDAPDIDEPALRRHSSIRGLPILNSFSPTRPGVCTSVNHNLRQSSEAGYSTIGLDDVTTRLRATSLSTHHKHPLPVIQKTLQARPSPPSPRSGREAFFPPLINEDIDKLNATAYQPDWLLNVDLRSTILQYSAVPAEAARVFSESSSPSNTFNSNWTRRSADSGRVASDHRSEKSTDSYEPAGDTDVDAAWLLHGRLARRDSGAFAVKGMPTARHECDRQHSSAAPSTNNFSPIDTGRGSLAATSEHLSRRSKTTALTMTQTADGSSLSSALHRPPKATTDHDDVFHSVGAPDLTGTQTTQESRAAVDRDDQISLCDSIALSTSIVHIGSPLRRRAVTSAAAGLEHTGAPRSLELASSPELSASADHRGIFSPFPSAEVAQSHRDDVEISSRHSGVGEEQITLDEADPRAVAAALQYHRTSPSGATGRDLKKISCELCGALVLRWAILLPCNHRACSACCCSGVNQVSTTPPRRHVCAACQIIVTGLTLSLPAAEAAQAAAWFSEGEGDCKARQVAFTDPRHYPAADLATQGLNVTKRGGTGDLTGRFPGVAEALLGIDRPLRGSKEDVVAAALARQPLVTLPSETDEPANTDQNTSSEGASNTADLSMTCSEDASFYGPQRSRRHPRTHTGGNDFSPVKHASSSYKSDDPRQPTSTDSPHGTVDQQPVCIKAAQACSMGGSGGQQAPIEVGFIAIVRIDNIPWKTSYQDIVKWIPDPYELLPDAADVAQPVHVPIDVKTGKTANCAFVELKDESSAKKLIRRRNNTKLCGRPVSLLLSNYEELINEIFPSVEHFPLGTPTRLLTYFTHWQLEQLIQLLKNGGPQLKSPLKPIEYTVSLIQLVPDDLSPDQRDLLAEKALGVLKKGTQWLNSRVDGLFFALHRLIQAAVNNRTFTKAQKDRIIEYVRQIPEIRVTTSASSRTKQPQVVVLDQQGLHNGNLASSFVHPTHMSAFPSQHDDGATNNNEPAQSFARTSSPMDGAAPVFTPSMGPTFLPRPVSSHTSSDRQHQPAHDSATASRNAIPAVGYPTVPRGRNLAEHDFQPKDHYCPQPLGALHRKASYH